jgi:hypothetical protein
MINANKVDTILVSDEVEHAGDAKTVLGPIAKLEQQYGSDGQQLLGYVLDMAYEEATVVTCDAWKRNCGGVPKNSFILIKVNAKAANLSPSDKFVSSLILGRVIEAVGTPLSSEIQQTIFQIHKVQAVVDPYTDANLQWSALKIAILGTYYDQDDMIEFGNDIDSYVSPHFYEVYVPTDETLRILVNTFVSQTANGRNIEPINIGELRYTETHIRQGYGKVPILVTPLDFTSNRTALFGKTRMGKSNTVKIIADMMIRSGENVGQIIFDLNGEYSNLNEQDNTSLFDIHTNRCIRYSLRQDANAASNKSLSLKANFFEQIRLGHSIITSLWDSIHTSRPQYLGMFLDWDTCDFNEIEKIYPEIGDQKRYKRAISMYFAILVKAGYVPKSDSMIYLHVSEPIRQQLAQSTEVQRVARMVNDSSSSTKSKIPEIEDKQTIEAAGVIYTELLRIYNDQLKNPGTGVQLFPPSKRTGLPYFDEIHLSMLRMIGDTSVSGFRYLIPFRQYHDVQGGEVVKNIINSINDSKTVIVDLSNADEVVARFYSDLICRGVFRSQSMKFTKNSLGDHSILFYFEEAHNLFNRDDRDLKSIYNRLAKEGAKYRIGMVYATQSMTTLSPDLLKNTENFFIAHLNDDREITELTKRYEFRDIGLDVQRSKTKGYVRMITLSHRFALPVQIVLFGSSKENNDGL